MRIEITSRHGSLEPDQQEYLNEKAQKLPRFFGRLMAIEVEVDQCKGDWQVEILVSAEHKHDIVARETASTVEAAMDHCVQKVENQLRRYKERIQNHKGDMPQSGSVFHGGSSTPPGESSAPPSVAE